MRLLKAQEEKKKLKGVSKSVRKPFSRVLDEEMQKPDVKIDPVAFAKGAEVRLKVGKIGEVRRKSMADRINLSKEYINKKAKEGHGTPIGSIRFSKRIAGKYNDLVGKTAVAIVFDRLKRGKYEPLWGKKSIHLKDNFLGGGVGFSFDLDNKTDKGQAVIASAEAPNSGVRKNLEELNQDLFMDFLIIL